MFPKVERCEKKKEIKGMAIGKMLYVEELFINFLLILNQNIYKLHWQKQKLIFASTLQKQVFQFVPVV